MNLFISFVTILLAVLIIYYWLRCKEHPWTEYIAKIAWTRAGIYFCCCYLLAYFTGSLDLLIHSAPFTDEQLGNSNWQIYTACCFIFIFVAYSGVWSYYTPVFDRKKNITISAFFGFLWGSSAGLLFLSVWLIFSSFGWPTWATWVATWLLLGAYQPNWHSIYWDHYIAPEHDTPMTQKIKAIGCHIPNLTITLTYLAIYENYLIFVLLQTIACVSAAIGLRYPAPWATSNKLDFAHRNNAKPPRCTGYIVEDYTTDPYTTFYPGWNGDKNR